MAAVRSALLGLNSLKFTFGARRRPGVNQRNNLFGFHDSFTSFSTKAEWKLKGVPNTNLAKNVPSPKASLSYGLFNTPQMSIIGPYSDSVYDIDPVESSHYWMSVGERALNHSRIAPLYTGMSTLVRTAARNYGRLNEADWYHSKDMTQLAIRSEQAANGWSLEYDYLPSVRNAVENVALAAEEEIRGDVLSCLLQIFCTLARKLYKDDLDDYSLKSICDRSVLEKLNSLNNRHPKWFRELLNFPMEGLGPCFIVALNENRPPVLEVKTVHAARNKPRKEARVFDDYSRFKEKEAEYCQGKIGSVKLAYHRMKYRKKVMDTFNLMDRVCTIPEDKEIFANIHLYRVDSNPASEWIVKDVNYFTYDRFHWEFAVDKKYCECGRI